MKLHRDFFDFVIPSMLAFALSGVYAIADGFFVGNALGDNALAAVLFLLLLVLPEMTGIQGVWLAVPISQIAVAVLSIILIRYKKNHPVA